MARFSLLLQQPYWKITAQPFGSAMPKLANTVWPASSATMPLRDSYLSVLIAVRVPTVFQFVAVCELHTPSSAVSLNSIFRSRSCCVFSQTEQALPCAIRQSLRFATGRVWIWGQMWYIDVNLSLVMLEVYLCDGGRNRRQLRHRRKRVIKSRKLLQSAHSPLLADLEVCEVGGIGLYARLRPFAYLPPPYSSATLSTISNFVESAQRHRQNASQLTSPSVVLPSSAAPPLARSAIIANFDGVHKHKTVIVGDSAHLFKSAYWLPVFPSGNKVTTGAGSAITSQRRRRQTRPRLRPPNRHQKRCVRLGKKTNNKKPCRLEFVSGFRTASNPLGYQIWTANHVITLYAPQCASEYTYEDGGLSHLPWMRPRMEMKPNPPPTLRLKCSMPTARCTWSDDTVILIRKTSR